MQLGKITVHNFMSIVHAEFDFRNKGLVLIQGINDDSDAFESNGAGKSTLFSEAPTWALYGETIRGQRGDKVINRAVGSGTSVAIEVIDDNGDVYEVCRHRKHSLYKNHVHLYRNGVNITGKADKDTDQLIVDLLDMDYLTFTNSIMFGQGVTKMFANSTDKEQKSILEKMLQIDIYKQCQDLAKEKLKMANDHIHSIQTDITTNAVMKHSSESSLEGLQRNEAELEAKCNRTINTLVSEKWTLKTELEELQSKKAEGILQAELDDMNNLIENIDDSIESIKPYQNMLNDANAELSSTEKDIAKLDREVSKKVLELDNLKSGKNVPKTCSSCGQDLPLNDTSHMEKHIADAIEELKKERQELADTSKLKERVTVLKEKTSKLDKYEAQRRSLQAVKLEIVQEIKALDRDIEKHQKDIDSIEKQIVEQENLKQSTFTEAIESTISSIEKYKAELAELNEALGELNKQAEDYEFWVNGYGNSGIKSILLDSVVPFLDTKANEYLAILADSSIEVKFHTQQLVKSTGEYKDKFAVEVINRNGDDDYKSNSGGEKRRIDIAINMALQALAASRSSKSIDLVVYDEVFEALDEMGSHKVIELLEQKAKEVGTIVVITHNDSLKQLFTQSIFVTKSDGKTVISND